MKTLVMLKTRGLLGPVVQKSTTKPATVSSPRGVKSTGSYRVYKVNNP